MCPELVFVLRKKEKKGGGDNLLNNSMKPRLFALVKKTFDNLSEKYTEVFCCKISTYFFIHSGCELHITAEDKSLFLKTSLMLNVDVFILTHVLMLSESKIQCTGLHS